MNITEAVKRVADKFVYRTDLRMFLGFLDHWFVIPERDNKLIGDCEDFTLTCFWYHADQSILKFLWHLLITHKYKVYQVKDVNNSNHIVGCTDNLWFDNWTFIALPKTEFFEYTKHTIVRQVYAPFMILPLIAGYFVRSRT